MRKIGWLVAVLLLLLVVALTRGGTSAQAPETERYFPETGHWVTGEFLKKYLSATDPQLLYGNPITEIFKDPETGVMVQYFEKARLDLHPEAPEELRVQQAPLGDLIYEVGPPIPLGDNPAPCRTFAETSLPVCFTFLEFFEKHGGVAQFGFPISSLEDQEGRIMQYFQRGRLEWHPELPAGERVVVGDLGQSYFYTHNQDRKLLKPFLSDNSPRSILKLQVRAFPEDAVTPLQGKQTIYVVVQDQHLQPVPGADVSLTFRSPSGQETDYTLAPTDSSGITKFTFQFDSKEYGLANVLVKAAINNLQQDTITSFRLWK